MTWDIDSLPPLTVLFPRGSGVDGGALEPLKDEGADNAENPDGQRDARANQDRLERRRGDHCLSLPLR